MDRCIRYFAKGYHFLPWKKFHVSTCNFFFHKIPPLQTYKSNHFPIIFLCNKNHQPLKIYQKKMALASNSNPQLPNTPNTLTNPPPLQLKRHVASSGITTAQGAPKTSRMGPCRAKLIPPPQRRQGRRPWPRTTVEAQRSDASSWGQNVVGTPMMTGTIYHL